MHELVRAAAAALVGAVTASAVLAGPPALAGAEAKVKQVTSSMIKNGTVKPKDLNPKVKASLARADTALQEVPDGAVTGAKLADHAVGASEIAEGAVGPSEIAEGAVGPSEIEDNSLSLADVARASGSFLLDLPNLGTSFCVALETVSTGVVLDDAIILLEDAAGVAGSVQLDARQITPGSTQFEVVACNIGGAYDAPATTVTWAVLDLG